MHATIVGRRTSDDAHPGDHELPGLNVCGRARGIHTDTSRAAGGLSAVQVSGTLREAEDGGYRLTLFVRLARKPDGLGWNADIKSCMTVEPGRLAVVPRYCVVVGSIRVRGDVQQAWLT